MLWIGIVIGLVVGGPAGFLACAALTVGKEADKRVEQLRRILPESAARTDVVRNGYT